MKMFSGAAARLAGCALLASTLACGQITITNREDVSFNLGFLGQAWGDWNQTTSSNGTAAYQQNLYLRRIRLMVGGQLARDITFFFDTDQPNLGKTPKVLNSGFLVQDAFLEWK